MKAFCKALKQTLRVHVDFSVKGDSKLALQNQNKTK